MTDTDAVPRSQFVSLTAGVVSAYLANNVVQKAELGPLIASVHQTLRGLGGNAAPVLPEKPTPMVAVKKSVTPDYIISLEDGRHYKSLKRHLNGRGLTPDAYREKWGLPSDYPMVAPNYAKQRSALAKSMGLGRQSRPATEK